MVSSRGQEVKDQKHKVGTSHTPLRQIDQRQNGHPSTRLKARSHRVRSGAVLIRVGVNASSSF